MKEPGALGLLALTALAFLLAQRVGLALYPVFAELAATLAILTIVFAVTTGMSPVDRAVRSALLSVLLLSVFQEALLWQRGDSRPAFNVFIYVMARTAFMVSMTVWTAMVSSRRGPGQYVYNLAVVGAIAAGLGQVLANLIATPLDVNASGYLAATLQGACTGCGFAYITMRGPLRDSQPVA